MSTFVLPKTLSRRGATFLERVQKFMGPSGEVWPTGTPPSAMTTLMNGLQLRPASITRAIRDLEREGLAHHWLLVNKGRKGRGGVLSLRLVINVSGTPWVKGLCATCGQPVNGSGRWCPTHKQTEGRHDRKWQVAAECLLELGHKPGVIASILKRPYMVASNEDGRSANGGAVVPYLIGQGLLGQEWVESLRCHVNGEGD